MNTDWQLIDLVQMTDICDDAKVMVRVICAKHGAVSAGDLYNVNREAFNELCEAAESLLIQLGADDE